MRIFKSKITDKQPNANNISDKPESQKVIEHTKVHRCYISKTIVLGVILVIICITNISTYAFSSDYREHLSDILHINNSETHYIGSQDSNNGIIMTIVSSHVVNKSAVIYMKFEKENGKAFGNGMNPIIDPLIVNNNEMDSYGYTGAVSAELSKDSKILNCYYTCIVPDDIIEKTVKMNISKLECNQSQVVGKTWPDQVIDGEWTVSFRLEKDTDNTLTVMNDDNSKKVSLCGKELQINSILISDMLLTVNTTTLSQTKVEFDPVSNISMDSGAYYGIYIRLKYMDGNMSDKMDCFLDNDNNIIAWFPKTIDKANITEVFVGDNTIKVRK